MNCNPGGSTFKMANSLVWSSPNTPKNNIGEPCSKILGHLPSCQHGKQKGRAYSVPKDRRFFFTNETHMKPIFTNIGKIEMLCSQQGEEENPATDEDARSSYSDWNRFYESEASDCEE